MAVTIAIGKQATKQVETADTQQESTFDPRIDELAALIAWEAKIKKDPRAVRLAELKKELAKEVADQYDDEPLKGDITLEGEKYRYKFGKRAMVRTVTPEGKVKFANLVGEEAFLECATIALKDIDQYVPLNDQEDYLEKGWGARTGKLEAKMPDKK